MGEQQQDEEIIYDKYTPLFELAEVGPCYKCGEEFLRFSFQTPSGYLSTQKQCCSCRHTPQLYLPKQLQSDTLYLPPSKVKKMKRKESGLTKKQRAKKAKATKAMFKKLTQQKN